MTEYMTATEVRAMQAEGLARMGDAFSKHADEAIAGSIDRVMQVLIDPTPPQGQGGLATCDKGV